MENDTVITKVCADKNCESAGRPQPINKFPRWKSFVSRLNPEGIANICKACANRRVQDRNKDKPAKQKQIRKQPQVLIPANNQRAEVIPAGKDFFILDFSRHPDLYDKLIEMAAEKFRTPELQILFLCNQAINGHATK